MASRSKQRAVESGVPQSPDPLVQCDDKEEDEVEDKDENNDDSDEEEDEEDDVTDEKVNIEFEAYSLSDNDYDGIKKLLQQLFLKDPVNTAEITDLLIQQNHIVSVIKQTDVSEDSEYDVDEDEVFGFISLLNLTERKDTQCAEQIQELILSFCEKNCEKSMVEQLDKFLNDTTKPVGLLLSERFINIPPQIALPMYQQLQKELAEAHRTNKPCGKCYFYLLISKTFVEQQKEKGNSEVQLLSAGGDQPGTEATSKKEVTVLPNIIPEATSCHLCWLETSHRSSQIQGEGMTQGIIAGDKSKNKNR
uniref:BRCA2 and CDKN1A-interacting protein n=1 Tax=Theropithecus gelada TaxID=9565 RepID=A0A8D2E668_THEGE